MCAVKSTFTCSEPGTAVKSHGQVPPEMLQIHPMFDFYLETFYCCQNFHNLDIQLYNLLWGHDPQIKELGATWQVLGNLFLTPLLQDRVFLLPPRRGNWVSEGFHAVKVGVALLLHSGLVMSLLFSEGWKVFPAEAVVSLSYSLGGTWSLRTHACSALYSPLCSKLLDIPAWLSEI